MKKIKLKWHHKLSTILSLCWLQIKFGFNSKKVDAYLDQLADQVKKDIEEVEQETKKLELLLLAAQQKNLTNKIIKMQ